jgi:hypothetical protein
LGEQSLELRYEIGNVHFDILQDSVVEDRSVVVREDMPLRGDELPRDLGCPSRTSAEMCFAASSSDRGGGMNYLPRFEDRPPRNDFEVPRARRGRRYEWLNELAGPTTCLREANSIECEIRRGVWSRRWLTVLNRRG